MNVAETREFMKEDPLHAAHGPNAMAIAAPQATSPFLVLGMHKSGTTLISEILHVSGIAMIENDHAGGYDDGNKMERDATRQLNVDLLDCHGDFSTRVVSRLDPARVNEAHLQRGRELVAELSASGAPWGFKDPRTLLTFEFWGELLQTPKIIGVFRDPVEVFHHYSRRSWSRLLTDPLLYHAQSIRAWCVYNQALIDIMRKNPGAFLIDYGRFMRDSGALKALERFVGRPLVDKRMTDMHRSAKLRSATYRTAEAFVRWRYGLDAQRIAAELNALATAVGDSSEGIAR